MEHENLQNPISRAELERRWAAARAGMAERGIDALIMQNSTDHLGGYVRWFTDLPAYNGSPRTVIFDKAEPMVAIQQGQLGVNKEIPAGDQIFRGTGRKLFSPSYIPVHYTRHYDAECAVREIRRRGYRTVG